MSRILNETANFTLDSVAKIAAALQKDVVLRLMNYDDEVVIRPFVKQEEYWFNSTQDFSASDRRKKTDSLFAVPYEETASQLEYVHDDDFASCAVGAGV